MVIVATGGQERSTELYLHGTNPHVITQSKLEAVLADGDLPPELLGKKNPTVVMIQCVESRNDEHPYCSRVCCSEAVKNALEIKRRVPDANVVVLGRDIRTYGFREVYFQKAREEGFCRASPRKGRPQSWSGRRTPAGDGARRSSNRELMLRPDLLVLSTGTPPLSESGAVRAAAQRPHRRRLLPGGPSQAPSGGSRANEGEFLCGLAHSPRFMDETIAHAQATWPASHHGAVQGALEIPGQVAKVDPETARQQDAAAKKLSLSLFPKININKNKNKKKTKYKITNCCENPHVGGRQLTRESRDGCH